MLRKVMKAIAKLEARAKQTAPNERTVGTSLSKKLRATITDLDSRAKEHDLAASAVREAAQRLRGLLQTDATANRPSTPVATPAVKKPATKTPVVKKATPPAKPSAPVQKKTPAPKAATRRPAPASAAAKSKTGPTLADAIHHVLKSRHDQNSGGATARQLLVEVQQAGYQFGGQNVENRLNYLHKTLRQNSNRIKRDAAGLISLT
jgi:FtsZ-interacting cell division protein ZipA